MAVRLLAHNHPRMEYLQQNLAPKRLIDLKDAIPVEGFGNKRSFDNCEDNDQTRRFYTCEPV
jgi:hypothetical protein